MLFRYFGNMWLRILFNFYLDNCFVYSISDVQLYYEAQRINVLFHVYVCVESMLPKFFAVVIEKEFFFLCLKWHCRLKITHAPWKLSALTSDKYWSKQYFTVCVFGRDHYCNVRNDNEWKLCHSYERWTKLRPPKLHCGMSMLEFFICDFGFSLFCYFTLCWQ